MVVLKRPRHHPALDVVRLCVTILFAVHVFISAWLVATVDGAYTEGKPAPTELHSLVVVDKDQSYVDVKIEKGTAFILYNFARDRVSEQHQNTTTQSQSIKSPSYIDWLEMGRGVVAVSLLMVVASEVVMLLGLQFGQRFRVLSLLLAMMALFILFPLSYVLDLNASTSVAQNTPGFDLEDTSFAHVSTSSDSRLLWLGLAIEGKFSGYDLGLVAPENRTDVIAHPPEKGTKDANSYIAFESTFSISYGKNLDALFVLPLTWFFLPSRPKEKASREEE